MLGMKKIFIIIFLGAFFLAPIAANAVEYKSCCVCINIDTSGMGQDYYTLPAGSTKENPITAESTCDTHDAFAVDCMVMSHEECGEVAPPAMTTLSEEMGLQNVVLGVAIPNLHFSAPPTEVDAEGNIYIPWAGEYVKAIYNFAVVVISILAVVVLILSGAQIITSAGGPAKGAAYKRVTQAVIGLFIAWGSYVVLYAINPGLTTFNSLKIKYIEKKDITGVEYVGESISKEAILSIINKVSESSGVDKCILETIVAKESGYKSNRIGHDEDVPRTQVGSRVKFVKSGKKYSGATFTPSSNLYTDKILKNDDSYNPDESPNYGLDVRFTHGGGLGQFTVLIDKTTKEMTRCPDGNIGRSIGGTCYNFPQLMDPQTAVELSAKLIQNIGTSNLEKLFYRYAGKGCSARVSQCRKMKAYAECKKDINLAKNEVSDCTLWLKETSAHCVNPSYRNPASQPTPDDAEATEENDAMIDEETGQSIQNY
jgi:hypothetical protein